MTYYSMDEEIPAGSIYLTDYVIRDGEAVNPRNC